jgi:hypothetical protein
MNLSAISRSKPALAAFLLVACASLGACASVPSSSATPAPAAAPPQKHSVAPSELPSGTMATLRELIDSHQLTELRTTYNGTYGASLLFQSEKLGYFVVLFHAKEFWRVIQTDSYDNAEALYRTFADQTQSLAKVDLDALRLQAQKTYAERMVALNEQRLQALQHDLTYQQQQARLIATQQAQAKQQTATLSDDLRMASSRLDAVKQHIQLLEAQQKNPTLDIPPITTDPAASGVAATASSNPATAASGATN